MSTSAHRLPTSVRPSLYDVDITTDPSREDFVGVVSIHLNLREPTARIQMHAKHLDLSNATIGAAKLEIEFNETDETVTFIAANTIPAGDATLTVKFRGKPSPSMHGLYLAKDGGERAICTQCEATDARAIFPCFDEPAFKARIRWTIRTPDQLVALSNGVLNDKTEDGGLVTWRFDQTEPVSSYLAALAVGDFEGTEPTEANGTPIRVWSMRGKNDQAAFAHAFTEKLLPWYETYFGIDYPYGKYDQVAVPGFDAGAMENVGLVLFRQNLLLMNPQAASWNQEKLIAKVIAHELAHMWFGNLVTMKWWDDLWLNEAFAEWFAHKATHVAAPDYEVWNDFQADKNRALVDDALPTTHPIWAPVDTPSQAIEMFDVITYQKGCAVMRMLENFLGEDDFREGIRTYMQAFREDNAAGADLWRHLEEASKRPVGDLMKSWIEQPGFPLVRYSIEGDALGLQQSRFWSSPQGESTDQVWNVPMVVRYEDDEGVKTHRFILAERAGREVLPAKGTIRWCHANANEIGFYRCHPEGDATRALIEHGIQHLTPVEQMGTIEDQWALVRNGTNDIAAFMPVLEAFSASTDHNVVRSLVDRFGTLDALLDLANETEALEAIRRTIRQRFATHVEALGYDPREGESQNDVQRRAIAIHAVASIGRDEHTIARCDELADRENADPRSIDPNLAGVFVGVAAKFGDEERYSRWVDTYRERKAAGAAPQDSLRYLYTLAAFRPEALVERTIASLDDGVIPQEAVGTVVSQLLALKHSQVRAWAYLRKNWESLRAQVGDMGISRVVESVGRLPGEHRGDIVAFFDAHPPTGAERALARALESLDQREELKRRLVPGLRRYLLD